MNIFERAARRKLRFPSSKGELLPEQLFDLPLTHARAINLDAMAQEINAELQTLTVSFVKSAAGKDNDRRIELQLKLDIIRHVIETREKAAENAEKAQETSARKQQLLEALANQKAKQLESMTPEEIQKELDAIG